MPAAHHAVCCPPAVAYCCSTGERNGFTVLTEEEFYDFHLTTPDLSVMLIRVRQLGSHSRWWWQCMEERGWQK